MRLKQIISSLSGIFRPMLHSRIILLAALCITALYNYTLFEKISEAYQGQILFQISNFIIFFCLNFILLNLAAHRRAAKPVLMVILLFAALHAYFTDSFGVIGDQEMIRNILWTDPREVSGWFNLRLIGYFIFLGVIPASLVYMIPATAMPLKRELTIKGRDIIVALLVMAACLFSFSASYATFFREHLLLRHYANPVFFLYSSGRLVYKAATVSNPEMASLGREARIADTDTGRELVIFVLGETARADRFSLNGYHRETNPLLKKEDILNFTDVASCGTSTIVSVPCLFSNLGRENYTHEKALSTENLLDVLGHTGRVNVLWRDNNSDSKGVALRATYQDFRTQTFNPVCDLECRDEGMLAGLQEYIDKKTKGDIFIVLHQLGNHGPEYYKRYPKQFEKFTPVCKSNDLGTCSDEEISNAYDNVILYTDYFLSQVIGFLKSNDSRFETSMIYVSDHGESLGENGLYLHGMPYAIAPVAQTQVPLIMWFGDSIKHEIKIPAIRAMAHSPYSHDNIFHTVLGLMEVNTPLYDPAKSILNPRGLQTIVQDEAPPKSAPR